MSVAHIDRRRRDWLLAAFVSVWGAPVSLMAQQPPRLVSVAGSITEIVYALGKQSLLVGADSTSTYPEAAQRLPRVGYMRQLSAEGVLSLHPTFLLATSEAGPPAVIRQLRDAGLRVLIVPVEYTWDDVRRKIEAVGLAAHAPSDADALWQRVASARAEVERHIVVQASRSPRAVFVLGHGGSPSVAGRGTAGDAIIRLLGAHNPLHDRYEGYRMLSAEGLAGLAIDAVITTRETLQAMGGEEQWWQRPQWQGMAQRGQRPVLWYEDALALLGFGPRLPEVLRRGAKALGTWRA
jgi:iron complex transport system substrate-binding protein